MRNNMGVGMWASESKSDELNVHVTTTNHFL